MIICLRTDLCFSMSKGVAFIPKPSGGFGIGQDELSTMTRDNSVVTLEQIGGVSYWACCLCFIFLFWHHFRIYYMFCPFFFLSAPLRQVHGVSDLLNTNLEKGILGDDADLLKRRNEFGSNTYPEKKGKSFWVTSFIVLLFIYFWVGWGWFNSMHI